MSGLSTPQAVVERAYDLISFGPGDQPGWPDFRALFAPGAILALRLFPGDPEISVLNLDDYERLQVTKAMSEAGYEERILKAEYTEQGSICEARVAFQMIFGPEDIHDAVDVFLLARLAGTWRIVSILSEVQAVR